jgi:hypothetical protein
MVLITIAPTFGLEITHQERQAKKPETPASLLNLFIKHGWHFKRSKPLSFPLTPEQRFKEG